MIGFTVGVEELSFYLFIRPVLIYQKKPPPEWKRLNYPNENLLNYDTMMPPTN